MLILIDDFLRIHRPGHHDASLRIQTQQTLHTVAFRFKFQKGIGLLGKERNNLFRNPNVWVQGEAVRDLTRPDAKEELPMTAKELMGLLEKVPHIAEYLERRILCQVILKVAIAAFHGTVAGKVDHKIVAAYLSIAPRTLFKKIPFVAHQEKMPFSFS
jgi:hypothetical protein